MRQRLPNRRLSHTYSLTIDSPESPRPVKIHVILGRYPDGALGEVSIYISQVGSIMRASIEAWAQLASLALQHGVKPAALARSLKGIIGTGGTLRADIESMDGIKVTSPWDAVAILIAEEA